MADDHSKSLRWVEGQHIRGQDAWVLAHHLLPDEMPDQPNAESHPHWIIPQPMVLPQTMSVEEKLTVLTRWYVTGVNRMFRSFPRWREIHILLPKTGRLRCALEFALAFFEGDPAARESVEHLEGPIAPARWIRWSIECWKILNPKPKSRRDAAPSPLWVFSRGRLCNQKTINIFMHSPPINQAPIRIDASHAAAEAYVLFRHRIVNEGFRTTEELRRLALRMRTMLGHFSIQAKAEEKASIEKAVSLALRGSWLWD